MLTFQSLIGGACRSALDNVRIDDGGATTGCDTLSVTVNNVAPVLRTGKNVINDMWTFSNAGFTNALSTARFARNVAEYFTGGAHSAPKGSG